MPVRMHESDLTLSDTPVMKKRKIASSPLLATPTRVLEQVKNVSAGVIILLCPPSPYKLIVLSMRLNCTIDTKVVVCPSVML